MGSARGGVDIEAVAEEDPNAIVTQPVPIDTRIRHISRHCVHCLSIYHT